MHRSSPRALSGALLALLVVSCAAPAPSPGAAPTIAPAPTAPPVAAAASSPSAAPSTSPAAALPASSPSAVASASPVAVGAAAAGPLTKIHIAYSVLAGDPTAIWVAQEQGFFKKYGLDADLTYIGGSTQIVQAVLADQIDVAQAGGAAAISASLQGGDVKIVATMAPVFVMSLYARPDVQSVQDLKGKLIAVTAVGTTTDFARRVALQKNGLNPDTDVSVLQTKGVPESLAALLSGQVAAAVLTPPQTLQARQAGMKELVNLSNVGVPYEQGSVIASGGFARDHKPELKAFLEGVIEGIAAAKRDKSMAEQVIAKYTKVQDPGFLDETYQAYVVNAYQHYPFPSLPGLQTALDFMTDPKAKEAKPEQFVDTSVLQSLEDAKFADQFYP